MADEENYQDNQGRGAWLSTQPFEPGDNSVTPEQFVKARPLFGWRRQSRESAARHSEAEGLQLCWCYPMDYMLKRWRCVHTLPRDGSICMSNNAAERGVRGIVFRFLAFASIHHPSTRSMR